MLGHIHCRRKKEGHPFKCGAAAVIHLVKMGKKGSDRGQIAKSFLFIHLYGWRVATSPQLKKSTCYINQVMSPESTYTQ